MRWYKTHLAEDQFEAVVAIITEQRNAVGMTLDLNNNCDEEDGDLVPEELLVEEYTMLTEILAELHATEPEETSY